MEVKQVIADTMKEDTNVNVILSDVLIKLLETREEFYASIINEIRINNLKVIENINMRFEIFVVAINNICVSSRQANKNLLNKLDTLTSCIKNTNAVFNKDYQKFKTTILQEFYQAFRYQELSECYSSLISGD